MITMYTGTPGSGKSYNACRRIFWRLKKKNHNQVIANFAVNREYFEKYKFRGQFYHFWPEKLNVPNLIEFAETMHEPKKESQTLLVFDEASLIFNAREWAKDGDRKEWLSFFAQHRKFGYEIIFICQDDRQLDRQIRSLVEYEKIHRKVSNYKLLKYLPFTLFVCVQVWYSMKMKTNSEWFFYHEKFGEFYDTYNTFNYQKKVEG